jgi:hypothetical protein
MEVNVFETLSSILMIVCSIFGIICALIFIIIVTIQRQYHALTILLVLNSTIAGLIANVVCISQAVYQLLDFGNDTGALYHTLCVQALHRLFVTVYSTRRSLQTTRCSIYMIIVQWIFSATFGLPMLLTKRITYQPGSRICQVQIRDFLFWNK